jgi:cytidyltransferase-like protein
MLKLYLEFFSCQIFVVVFGGEMCMFFDVYFDCSFMKTIVITSWYFNPIHPWHIECLELAKQLWDELWVLVNNDNQVRIKTWKNDVFQDQDFRMRIVWALKVVDRVLLVTDKDGSVCESLKYVSDVARKEYWVDVKLIFAKWGDRFASNIPELDVCEKCGIEIRDGLWAKTHNSSEYRKKLG